LKISTPGVWVRRLRSTTVIVALVSVTPMFAGCVSAVDESAAFGFNGTPQGAPDLAATAEGATKPDGAQSSATATEAATETAKAEAPVVAAAAENTEKTAAADKSDLSPLASGRTAIAAYAGATVGGSSETTPATAIVDPKRADSTLFASLFAQSEAKTPIRNAESGKARRVLLKPEGAPVPVDGRSGPMEISALPGVKTRASLFEIGQRASADYDAEILEEAKGEEGSYQVASLSGMARMAPNGLLVQRPDVQTGCFDPQLVSMIRAVERKFNTKVVVTSGYRSPSYNKRVNGAQKSMHMACKAADIQVPGANNLVVANFVRTLPGRGGVGTYCHTTAIHIDTGKERDWAWACRRRRA
jgi:uncharacterized protein YcbK (DUF882 family)